MIGTPLRLDLRRSRKLLAWLAVITVLYAGTMTLFYTNVAENAEEWEKLLEIYPKELLLAFGIDTNFADPGVFLTGYVFGFLWPLVVAITAIVLATRIAADAGHGFLDVVLATPLPRAHHLAASIATQLVGIVGLAVAMVLAIVVADLLIEPGLPTGWVLASALPATAFGIAIAGPSTLLAVLLLDRGRAAGLLAGVLVMMYLLNVIAAIAPDVKAVASLSVFHYFSVKELISAGAYPVADSLLLGGIGVACWALALVAFRRRDLTA